MLDVKKTLKAAEDRMNSAANYLQDELARIRAGRANVAILDGVRVMSYGSMVPLNQVANITVPDARTYHLVSSSCSNLAGCPRST